MGYATEHFSKRLKEIRETAGLTQAQLASELKVSRGAISYYENGDRTPDIEFLDSLSMYFDLPLDFVMGYTDNIKEEHRNMYEFYGLTDTACGKLEKSTKVGNLISAILGHKDFYALECLYKGIIENHKTFDICQMGYVGFLISDSLNKIICDSLDILWNVQFTQEEREALRIEHEIAVKEYEKMRKKWDEEDKKRAERRGKEIEEDVQLAQEEDAAQYAAIEKVHEKFFKTVEPAKFNREHP